MLPKSSQRVAEVIKLANQIAREYEQEYVGTEHVLMAILREGTGIGAAVLAKHGITFDGLRAEVDKLIKNQMEETWVFGRLPGTPHFKNVVAVAIKECQDLDAKELCTQHLLLALLKEKGSVAYKAATALGLTYDAVRADVVEMTAQQ
ncbi:MAG: Clp protease N-terminal domain-containing protein [Phycisphaerae bacterium]|jgi:ATP-dependent Clp protease ATP-binding subunit ClpC